MHNSSAGLVAAGGVLVLLAGLGQATDAPATPTKPVTDVYHGVKVVDDYRWLEDFADPVVHAWSSAQNARARAYLDALPLRVMIYERLKQLYGHPSPRYFALKYRGDPLFALKMEPPKEQAPLMAWQTPDDTASDRRGMVPTRFAPI